MYGMKRLALITLLFAALLPQDGWAGFCKNLQSKEELKDAYYIGIFKHLKTESAPFDPVKPGQPVLPMGGGLAARFL